MLPLLLGLALAQDADLETRLLGPEPAPVTSTAEAPAPAVEPASPSLEMPPWWTLPMLGVLLGWAYTQRRKTEKVEADAMRVLGRTALGKDAAVVLLEVRDAHGAWRRLLVGSGGDGPQLITGLGATNTASPVAPAATAPSHFAEVIERETSRLDALPEVPAYAVAPPPAAESPSSMVTSWNRADEPEPTATAGRPVLGPAGELAAAIHGRVPRGYPSTPPKVSTEPPPVQPEAPRRTAQDGLDLLDEVRRAKSRIGTRVQTYG